MIRTTEPSDQLTFGLINLWTIASNIRINKPHFIFRTHEPPVMGNNSMFGLSNLRTIEPTDLRTIVLHIVLHTHRQASIALFQFRNRCPHYHVEKALVPLPFQKNEHQACVVFMDVSMLVNKWLVSVSLEIIVSLASSLRWLVLL